MNKPISLGLVSPVFRPLAGVLAIGLIAGCGSGAGPSTLAEWGANVDEISCARGLEEFNPRAEWTSADCPGCTGTNAELMADDQPLTFATGLILNSTAGELSATIRPQEGVMFPGGGYSGFWFSRSMLSVPENVVRVEALRGDQVIANESHDAGFVVQGLKWPTYVGVDTRGHFDALRIVFESDLQASDIRVFAACLDQEPSFVNPLE